VLLSRTRSLSVNALALGYFDWCRFRSDVDAVAAIAMNSLLLGESGRLHG
jgi:hypothetical protein